MTHRLMAVALFFAVCSLALALLALCSHDVDPTDASADAVEQYRRRQLREADAQNEALRRAWRMDGTRMAGTLRAPERAARVERHHAPVVPLTDEDIAELFT